MEYRNLGRTGVKVSPLCLGTINFDISTPEDEAIDMINHAIESGINFIDTANRYGGRNVNEGAGRSEEIIGKALEQNGKRHRIILATKAFFPMDPDDPNRSGLSRRHIIAECNDSLKRLRTDYIDLFQLHRPDHHVPIDETLRALDDLIRAGKIRYIGTSSFSPWQIMEALWVSDKLRLNRFVSEQPFYCMIDRLIENSIVPMALRYGIALIPYSPLGGGILTGKYERDKPYPENSRWSHFKKGGFVWDSDLIESKVYDLLDVLKEISEEKGCTISQLALAWTMKQPGITSVIIGPRTFEQLEDNLGALNVEVTEQDCARINVIVMPRITLSWTLSNWFRRTRNLPPGKPSSTLDEKMSELLKPTGI